LSKALRDVFNAERMADQPNTADLPSFLARFLAVEASLRIRLMAAETRLRRAGAILRANAHKLRSASFQAFDWAAAILLKADF